MKILLFGGNGQLGTELRRALPALGEVVVATRSGKLGNGNGNGNRCEAADFDQPESLAALIERIAPAIVVNAAAYTAVDRAETEHDAAFRANAQSPGAIAEACARRDALLVHYSTDYVFDGSATRPYREDDVTAPLGVYGASKLAGEHAIASSGARYLILRTAWVYSMRGQNFLRTMLRLGAERDELRVVADQRGSPTPAWLVAEATTAILRQGIVDSGVRHLVAAGETHWYDFANTIFDEARQRGLIDKRPRVHPITTADYPTSARRPAYSVLDTSALRQEYDLVLPSWQQGLQRTLDAEVADGLVWQFT